mmetsp:Transcript_881/g.1702  ORF Transcript_881/g.1702 Transcript_881/m.1702 type:complete len:125 (-) Transcript_881:1993-2367(-)
MYRRFFFLPQMPHLLSLGRFGPEDGLYIPTLIAFGGHVDATVGPLKAHGQNFVIPGEALLSFAQFGTQTDENSRGTTSLENRKGGARPPSEVGSCTQAVNRGCACCPCEGERRTDEQCSRGGIV